MVVSLEQFKEHAMEYIEECVENQEVLVLKTGLGNMFLISEQEYMTMSEMDASDVDDILLSIQ